MVSIIVVGTKSKQKSVYHTLKKLLEKHFSCAFIDKNEIYIKDNQPKIILINSNIKSKIQVDKAIIIFDDIGNNKIEINSANPYIIVNTSKETDIEFLKANKLSAIPCGLMQKDTFTLSSNTPTSAVVSVQRTIKTIFDEEIEPLEIPVELNCVVSEYEILASVAVLTLLGEIKMDNKITIP